MLRLNHWLILVLFSFSTALQAQQVIDPLADKVQAKVEYLTGPAFNLNEKVYLFAKQSPASTQSSAGFSILEFDPKTQATKKVADVRESNISFKEECCEYQTGLPEAGIKIGNRLLLNIAQVGFVEWFDPKSESFYSAFANQPPAAIKNCQIQGWDNGPLLFCDQNNEDQRLVFQLDPTDELFHPYPSAAPSEVDVRDGLFCLANICHEWPSLQTYKLQGGLPPVEVVVRQKHLFWFLNNGSIVMQKRHSDEQTVLNTSALIAESKPYQGIGISPASLLYVTKDENGQDFQFKRLNFANQNIEQIDTTLFENHRNWNGSLLVCVERNGCAVSLPDDSFVMDYGRGGIAQLQSTSTQFKSIQEPWFTQDDYCCSWYIKGASVDLNEQVFYVANSCLFVTSSYSPTLSTARECQGKAPSYLLLPSTQVQELAKVQVTKDTTIGRLTPWKESLFWLEWNEQWRIKSYNPKTQQVATLDTFSDNLNPEHLVLLPGSASLWHIRYNVMYRLNPDTQRFEASETVLENYDGENGMLIDDSFYYVNHKYVLNTDDGISTYTIYTARVSRFDLTTGQVQHLKWLPSSSSTIRLLGISNGKVYLSEGILNLSDLAYTANKALARKMESAGGAMVNPTYSDLLKVFEYRQQLFGIAQHYISGWDLGGTVTRNLVKLDLDNQSRNLPAGRPVNHDYYKRPEPRVIQNGDLLFASWGQQFLPDGSSTQQQFTGEFFSNAIQFLDSTYLLSENQLGQWKQVNGKPVLQGNLLPAQQFANIGASMAELGGKLYYVAKDNADGERIRQIQLPNRPPVAKDESATTSNTSKITIQVLANDSDPDFDLLTVAEAKATQGLVSILPDQQLSYQPKAGFSGTDEIQYQVADGRGGVATAKVIITVTATATEVPQVTKPEAPAEKSGGSLGFVWLTLLWLGLGVRRHLSAIS
jgi:hypothetical protein